MFAIASLVLAFTVGTMLSLAGMKVKEVCGMLLKVIEALKELSMFDSEEYAVLADSWHNVDWCYSWYIKINGEWHWYSLYDATTVFEVTQYVPWKTDDTDKPINDDVNEENKDSEWEHVKDSEGNEMAFTQFK